LAGRRALITGWWQTAAGPASSSVVYSTRETWELPLALIGALTPQRFTHIVCMHRVYSAHWFRTLHRLQPFFRVHGWGLHHKLAWLFVEGLVALECMSCG